MAPLLSQIPLDAKELFKKDTSYNSQMAPPESTELKLEPGENGEASKENMDPLPVHSTYAALIEKENKFTLKSTQKSDVANDLMRGF